METRCTGHCTESDSLLGSSCDDMGCCELPGIRLKVLEKMAEQWRLRFIDPACDWVNQAGHAVDYVERRIEGLAVPPMSRLRIGLFIGDPTCIDSIHIDAVAHTILCACAYQHVQGRFGHIRVRMKFVLLPSIELPFHRRNLHNEPPWKR